METPSRAPEPEGYGSSGSGFERGNEQQASGSKSGYSGFGTHKRRREDEDRDCEGADGELAVHEQAVKSAESRLDALSRDRWAQYLSAKAADREVDSASAVLATARARLSTVQRRIELERTIRENNYKNLVPANFDTHRTHLLGGRQSI
ncbi:putative cell surface protein [Rhodotorula toruloides ATCC 204091]|uniref:BY PROTMAP: gi/342318871/gb/EGU10828.1/ putative cell surface protein [Rhodotorula glutinis ATCC 204091] n=1 Tax=Rhodotorula toruloides TaxID=5286 RepID=A0A0K3CDC1_RHOTO|nr:putative cell surface protein [Rhodotorula toruloides ATCC 204091]